VECKCNEALLKVWIDDSGRVISLEKDIRGVLASSDTIFLYARENIKLLREKTKIT